MSTIINLRASQDFASHWQLGFQDPATPGMEGITYVHHFVAMFLVFIAAFVFSVLGAICFKYMAGPRWSGYLKGLALPNLELAWTLFPSVVLFAIALMSFNLLYVLDLVADPELTVKVIGRQWYWGYEQGPFKNGGYVEFDSYLTPEEDLKSGGLRLLEVDNPLVLPAYKSIRILVTSSDVIHSWAVPSFGAKIDAIPGRLNEATLFIKRPGVFYGQCSEICGVNHGFMPIKVVALAPEGHTKWAESSIGDADRVFQTDYISEVVLTVGRFFERVLFIGR